MASLDISGCIIMIKRTMKTTLALFYLSTAVFLFGADGEVLYRQTVNVRALPDGKEKPIYSTIGKEKTENKISLTVAQLPAGDIEIRSEKFKLGKMPFSSSFQFTIPQTGIRQDGTGSYIMDNLSGFYKVAASKSTALLTGTIGTSSCELSLKVNGMGKKLTMQLFSVKNQTLNKEDEPAPNNEESASRSTEFYILNSSPR